ncbi:MAG: DUF4333 domain-containing protein [Solirubrobacterales bacterium]
MPRASSPRLGALLVVALLCLLLYGCSGEASVGKDTVSKEDVARQAQQRFDALAQKGGGTFPPVVCPSDLDAKVGATVRCTATGEDGTTLGITVSVTSIDEKTETANMHFQADSAFNQ